MANTMNITYQNVNGTERAPVAADRRALGTILAGLPRRILDTLLDWQERQRQRRSLMELDGRMLKDLGITRLDAQREFDKPFWRA